MTILLMLAGAVLAPFVCAGMFEENTGWTAAILGATIGLLFGQMRKLRARVTKLEQAVARAGEGIATAPAVSEAAGPTIAVAPARAARSAC